MIQSTRLFYDFFLSMSESTVDQTAIRLLSEYEYQRTEELAAIERGCCKNLKQMAE
jgi:hypothetical protein